MKVLCVINSLHFGGAEKLLFDTIPRFKEKGLAVDLMVLNNSKTFFYKALENSANINIIHPKKQKSVYHISHIFWIKKYLKHYNIVHVHLFPSLYWVALASLLTKNTATLLFTEHSTNNRRRKTVLLKYIDRFIYNRFTKIIAISKGVKENLEKHLDQNKDNIINVNNGVDTLFFKQAKPYTKIKINVPDNAKIIIQVGSFYGAKDQDTLLKALALLPVNTHLILVGDGPLLQDKKKLATQLKIDKRVHFLGFRKDVSKLLKTADICVLSSFYEGFGLAIVEGMASGKPCVGSNVKGLSEVLNNAGLVFEVGNHLQLKSILEKLLLNTAYYHKVAKLCQDKAKLYDISLMVNAHVKLYKNLKKEHN